MRYQKATRAAAGCILFVLVLLAATSTATTKKPPPKPVNINTANSEELQQVPGIGPVTAEKILQMRRSYGAFKSVDDLLAIKGLGRKRLEKMRKYLTVGKAAASGKPAAGSQTPDEPKRPRKSPLTSAPPASSDDPEDPPTP